MARADDEIALIEPREAAHRVVCLSVLLQRADVEDALVDGRAEDETFVDAARELREWMRSGDLHSSLSQSEGRQLESKIGSWSEQELIDVSWRREALAVILWSLGVLETLAPWDELHRSLSDHVPEPQDVPEFCDSASLRSAEIIREAREFAELWFWRAGVLRMERDPQRTVTIKGRSLREVVADTARDLERKGAFVAISDDFPVFGKAYRQVGADEQERLASVASERLWGLNWVCGLSADWDDVLAGG